MNYQELLTFQPIAPFPLRLWAFRYDRCQYWLTQDTRNAVTKNRIIINSTLKFFMGTRKLTNWLGSDA